jgi:8-oxo-dGTP pyrophosphatase MutT (NUDIX family)
MKQLLLFVGKIAYFFAWPAYFVYFKRSHGRTRIILLRKDKILVVRQWVGDGKWQLPGGGLHKNEAPKDGALRELQEETGVVLLPAQLRKAGRVSARSRGFSFECMVFVATTDQVLTLRPQPLEIADVDWVDLGELTPGNAHSDVLQCLDVAATGGLLKVTHKDHTSTYA